MKKLERFFFKILLRHYEKRIDEIFDPMLSRRIDAIRFLLEGVK
jgi:hypothetical protein